MRIGLDTFTVRETGSSLTHICSENYRFFEKSWKELIKLDKIPMNLGIKY